MIAISNYFQASSDDRPFSFSLSLCICIPTRKVFSFSLHYESPSLSITRMVKTSPVAVSGEPGGSLPTTEDPHFLDGSTTKVSQSTWQSTVKYLKTEITLEHADIPIIACCVVSGLCDSSAYNAWSCFVSMVSQILSRHCEYMAFLIF